MLSLACVLIASFSAIDAATGKINCDEYESVTSCYDQGVSQYFGASDGRGQVKLGCADLNFAKEKSLHAACKDKRVNSACLCTCNYRMYCENVPLPPFDDRKFSLPTAASCFSGDALVETSSGLVAVSELEHMENPVVKVVDSDNRIAYSPVRLWLHSVPGPAEHYELGTESGHKVTATSGHLVYEVPCNGGERSPRFMADLAPGQCVLVEQGGSMVPSPITDIRKTQKIGRYAFTTETGTIVVNGIAASNYGYSGNERAAHWFFSLYYYMKTFLPLDADGTPKHHPVTFGLFDWQKRL